MKQSESGAHQIAKDRPGTRDAFNKLDQRDNHLLQNRPKTQEFRQSAGNNIRDRIDRNDIRDRIDHHWNHWDNHHDWWRHTGWSDLALWGPWGWGEPYYYDYYGGVPYVYSESTGQYTQAPATGGYQQQQQQIKSQTADAPSTQQEWKPLGTFALSKDGMAASDPNLYLHLSMSKEGDLQGKLLNLITRSEKDVAGIVDPKSQLAAWKMVGDADTPIMETGIYNLTKSETPVQVNFADGRRQNMLMVRVDEKNAG
jgi:hypothetical protein